MEGGAGEGKRGGGGGAAADAGLPEVIEEQAATAAATGDEVLLEAQGSDALAGIQALHDLHQHAGLAGVQQHDVAVGSDGEQVRAHRHADKLPIHGQHFLHSPTCTPSSGMRRV